MKKIITPDRIAISFSISCLALALVLRLWDLELKPLHHDEGVNGWFMLRLYRDNFYHYDPSNYHGPFLYYLALIPFHLAGVSTFSLRLMPALFGALMIALLLPLRRKIGWAGVVAAGALLALSPANLFYSRYAIHETYLSFFTLGAVAAWMLFIQTKRPLYLYFTSAGLAFMVTVKETYIITFGVFGISLGLAWLLGFILSRGVWPHAPTPMMTITLKESLADAWRALWSEVRGRKVSIFVALLIFVAIGFLFYSSFFTHFKGVEGFLSTLKIWTRTGIGGSGHDKPFFYYLKVLYRFEAPILIFGILGIFYSLKKKDVFSLFIAFWGIGMFLAYSLIRYKTPWLMINLTLPMALLAGIFIQEAASSLVGAKGWIVFAALLAPVLGYSAYQAVDLNFLRYDDESQELAYVHTYRDINQLVDRIDSMAKLADGKRTAINVASPEYWPLAWYLRDYTGVSYWGKVIDRPDSSIIIGMDNDQGLLESRLYDEYRKEPYRLRPGVNLVLYIQKRLWDRWFIDSLKGAAGVEIPSDRRIEPGLIGRYYRGGDFVGEPFLTRSDVSLSFDWTPSRPVSEAFSAEWDGYIWIAQPGRYRFATESDDGSWVYIGETLVVDNGGAHMLKRSSGEINLTKGTRRIRVRYFDIGGGAILRLLWKPPWMREEGPIPANIIYSLREKKASISKLEDEASPGLWGKYYRGVGFSGETFLNRADTFISFHWDRDEDKPFRSPFSVEWEGYLLAKEGGKYHFTTESDDGSWLYVNDDLVVNNGGDHSIQRVSGEVDLPAGYHRIKIRYFDSGGGAILRLFWKRPEGNEEPIPKDVFYYISPQEKKTGLIKLGGKTAPGLWGKYYKGTGFSGEAFLNRADTSISFHWDRGEDKPFRSPFSVEWEGYLLAKEGGKYHFTTESDDGSWVYINDELIVDNSGEHQIRRVSGEVDLTSGYHRIRIRYFDSGGGTILRLFWKPPDKNEELIPPGVFYYIQPG